MVFCCGTKGKSTIKKPAVIREKVYGQQEYSARANPPLGALLTGASKLGEAGLTGEGVKVAVIDSGIDKEHPAFDEKVVKQKWFRHGSSLEEDDHGTHVAGTIHFMAPDAELYDYRVFGEAGNVGVDEAIRQAILMAIEDGCHVINMSLGGPTSSPGIQEAVKAATSKGILCVCAAGNDGDGDPLTHEISYPAAYEECMSIAAVAKKDRLPVARFSNSNIQVDYSGIGVDVVSMKPFGGFQKMSGTSMACPHVCGFIAAIMSESRDRIRARLTEKYARDIGLPGPDNSTGLGFVTYLTSDELASYFQEMGMEVKV